MKLIYILTSLTLLTLPAAHSQESPETSSEVKAENSEENKQPTTTKVNKAVELDKGIEKVEVTGSFIKRIDMEGPSPVVVIDREQIENSGFNSVSEVMRTSTVNPFGADAGEVNLKGIGSTRTLVLINGRRAPGSGGSYDAGDGVSVDFVPLAAVEKVEVLKDGASATYGSDALGGVVNIITRKDLDGFSFATKYDYTEPAGGDRIRTSLAYGYSTERFNLMTSLQHIYTAPLNYGSFNYFEDLNKDYFRSSNYLDDTNTIRPNPTCTSLNVQGRCEESLINQREVLSSNRWSGATEISYKLGSDTEFFTTISFDYDQEEESLFSSTLITPSKYGGPSQQAHPGMDFSAAQSPASWNTLPGYTGGDTRIWGRLDEMGRRRDEDRDLMLGIVTGLKGYYGNSDWEWNVALNNSGFFKNTNRYNYALYAPVKNAIDATTGGGTTYDPLSAGGPKDVTGFAHNPGSKSRFTVSWLDYISNGELGDALGATWASAIGLSAGHFEYKDKGDDKVLNQEIMGLQGAIGGGSRQNYAVFTELNGLFGKSFETQLSLRQDVYSDFGSTVNPKLALRYQPHRSTMIRASFGTGFQAPALQSAYGPQLEGFFFLVDEKKCIAAGKDPNHPDCKVKSFPGLQGANPNLTEEKSQSFNVGVVIEPVNRFTITMDMWRVTMDDVIGADAQKILEVEGRFGPAAVSKYNANIIRNTLTDEIERLDLLLQNAGREEVDGGDFGLRYTLKTKIGDFNFSTNHSYIFKYYQSFYQELGIENVVGQFGNPRWRNNTQFGYKRGWFSGQITARTTSVVERRSQGLGTTPQFTQYDLVLNFDVSKSSKLQLGVVNIAGLQPEFDDSLGSKIDSSLYTRYQTSYLTYRADF